MRYETAEKQPFFKVGLKSIGQFLKTCSRVPHFQIQINQSKSHRAAISFDIAICCISIYRY